MKILMIIPSLGSGGAERVLSSLANDWIRKEKCELELVVLMHSVDFYSIDNNIKIHRLNYLSGSKNKAIGIIELAWGLRKLVKEVKPDLCFSFIRESNIITIISSIGLSVKVVISERDSPNVQVSKLYAYLRKKMYPLADGIIVQTNQYKDFILKEIGNLNQKVIPNPVRSINVNEKKKEKIIISVGRLIPVKGHKYLIEAFSRCKNNQEWKLVILGDGILRDELQCQINELKLQNQVKLIGAVKSVDEWLEKSSVFAFTSLSEGFPNALAEAMSASLPCISFDCITGPRELIKDNESGYLIDVTDVKKFSEKLDILMESEGLRKKFGRNSKIMADTLNFDRISEEYFLFLKDI